MYKMNEGSFTKPCIISTSSQRHRSPSVLTSFCVLSVERFTLISPSSFFFFFSFSFLFFSFLLPLVSHSEVVMCLLVCLFVSLFVCLFICRFVCSPLNEVYF